ncbi:MAG TPA: cyclic nucleotide-binding domain-containing protein [Caldithrix abyssi]|uniref:Cyclic nucleotide-binding domain-containing protein n=1 Tax=Caldithrix abyssi TaxID=187145 RepID=A0A7V4U294_CALAY|nr:cyclic nucleotide-binding domain-containing protein [Caldithrix abyssi]
MEEIQLQNLKKIPLFFDAANKVLALIAERLETVRYSKGETIIREGDPGDAFYIILRGKVRISAAIDENDEIILSYLSDGDYFGEMALLTDDVRSATVTAEEDLELLKLQKEDFKQLVSSNAEITLSLTHMLSERLKAANKIREERERYFKQKIMPSGDLKAFDVISLLRFAEENSLSGKLTLKHDQDVAIFYYEKGQLFSLDFQNKEEDEALDIILQWEEGQFVIEPRLYELESQKDDAAEESGMSGEETAAAHEEEREEDTSAAETPPEIEEPADEVQPAPHVPEESHGDLSEADKTEIGDAVEKPAEETASEPEPKPAEEEALPEEPAKIVQSYLSEKLSEFIRLIGTRDLQTALNQSYDQFAPYFAELSDFKLQAMPEVHIEIASANGWKEKHTMLLAILLRHLVRYMDREVFGMDFWSPLSKDDAINRWLSRQGFFEYYDHADDFIRDL